MPPEAKRDMRPPQEVWREKAENLVGAVDYAVEKSLSVRARGYKASTDEIRFLVTLLQERYDRITKNLNATDEEPASSLSWKGVKPGQTASDKPV